MAMKQRVYITAFLVFFTDGCSSSSFVGASKVKSSSNGASPSGSNTTDNQSTVAPPSVSTSKETPPNNTNKVTPPKGLDPNGILTPSCKIVNPLPTTSTQLALEYNWHASGAHSAYTQVVATPIVGRLKATDAAPSILAVGFQTCDGGVLQPAYLFAIDGSDGSQKWVSTLQIRAWLPPAIGDLNHDGTMRIAVVGMDNLLHVLDANGNEQLASAEPVFDAGGPEWSTGLAVADLALDGDIEIIAGNKIYSAANGQLKFKVSGNGFSVVGDTDGKPGLEIVTSAGIFSGKDGSSICSFATPIDDPAIAVMHASDDHAMVIGVAGDPTLGGQNNAALANLLVYDGKNCSQVSSVPGSQPGGGPINIADFDGDGTLDFGTAGNDGYMAFHIGSAMWTTPAQDHSSQVTGSTTFDFNGSGKNEIIYADEIALHVFDGTTGAEIYKAPHASYTAREYPVVADVTGSGKARIVVAANSCLPGATINGIRVFKDPADAWVSTRPIWNQHAFNPLLVTDAGGLTGIKAESIYKPWLKAPYLAGFRNNISKPDIKTECR